MDCVGVEGETLSCQPKVGQDDKAPWTTIAKVSGVSPLLGGFLREFPYPDKLLVGNPVDR